MSNAGTFPIVVGRVTIAQVGPILFSCSLQTPIPTTPGTVGPVFNSALAAAVLFRPSGDAAVASLSSYVQLANTSSQSPNPGPTKMLMPPTAFAPSVVAAVNAALIAYAAYEGGAFPYNGSDDVTLLTQATFALSLAAGVKGSGYTPGAQPFPVPILMLAQS